MENNECHVPNHQPDWVYSEMVHESGIPVFPVFSSEWAEKPGLAWGHLQENMGMFYKCSLQFLQLDDSNPHPSSCGVSILASPSTVERNRST